MRGRLITYYELSILGAAKWILNLAFVMSAVILILACIDLAIPTIRWGYDWRSVIFSLFMLGLTFAIRRVAVRALSRLRCAAIYLKSTSRGPTSRGPTSSGQSL